MSQACVEPYGKQGRLIQGCGGESARQSPDPTMRYRPGPVGQQRAPALALRRTHDLL